MGSNFEGEKLNDTLNPLQGDTDYFEHRKEPLREEVEGLSVGDIPLLVTLANTREARSAMGGNGDNPYLPIIQNLEREAIERLWLKAHFALVN